MFYVYALIDPKNNKPFYIGKGKKYRMYAHVSDVKHNRSKNRHLYNKIKKILKESGKIEYQKLFCSDDEQVVFQYEIDTIIQLGLENLCNICSGGQGTTRKCPDYIKQILSEKFSGQGNPFYGKSHEVHPRGMLGKKHSNETRTKMSHDRKGRKQSVDWVRKRIESRMKTIRERQNGR